MDVKKEEAAVV